MNLELYSILEEEERVPCTFKHDCLGLGHLDSSVDDADVKQDTQVDIPLWLGEKLKKKKVVDINDRQHKHYGDKMRKEMRAGATSIDLRDLSYYYFDTGLHLARICGNDDLRGDLKKVFLGERYRTLTVRSLTPGSTEDASAYSQTLTSSELKIFNKGLKSMQNFQNWRTSEGDLLKKAPLLGRRDRGGQSEQPSKRRK